MTSEEKIALVNRHTECEMRQDWDGVLATMTADPCYVHYPQGLLIRGRDAVVEHWKRVLTSAEFGEAAGSASLRCWIQDDTVVTMWEWVIDLDDGETQTKNTWAVFRFAGGLIESETLYSDSDTDAFIGAALDAEFRSMPGVEHLEEVEMSAA